MAVHYGFVGFHGNIIDQPGRFEARASRLKLDTSGERRSGRCRLGVAGPSLPSLSTLLFEGARGCLAVQLATSSERRVADMMSLGGSIVNAAKPRLALLEDFEEDFTFAFWDEQAGLLSLGRPALSALGLYYTRTRERAQWASLAPLLASNAGLDPDYLAATRVQGPPRLGSAATAFANVFAVRPGSIVELAAEGQKVVPFARVGQDGRGRTDDEVVADLRASLQDSVARAVGSIDGPLATHLSGGRDSGAVTAMAAMVAHPLAKLTAYTYAPVEGVLEDHRFYRYDETAEAGCVAAMHPRIRHRVIRPSRFALCDNLDRRHAYMAVPIPAPTNLPWWDAIEEAAAKDGASVLLTGTGGNFTLSVGGPWGLNDLFFRAGFSHWWRAFRDCRQAPFTSVPSLLSMTFGARVPKSLYAALRRWRNGRQSGPKDRFLKGDLAAARRKLACEDDPRPTPSQRDRLFEVIDTADFAFPAGQFLHGIAVRDPTADRRLAALVKGMSLGQMVSRHDRRPLFERAFRDVLPDTTLRPTVKGSQGADWSRVMCPDEIRKGLDRYACSRQVCDWIDLDALRDAVDQWPSDPVAETAIERHFLVEVLPTIALASFVYVHSKS